jgi:hypothetical protein
LQSRTSRLIRALHRIGGRREEVRWVQRVRVTEQVGLLD